MKLRNLPSTITKSHDNIYERDVYSCSETREIIIKKKHHTTRQILSAGRILHSLNSQKRKK